MLRTEGAKNAERRDGFHTKAQRHREKVGRRVTGRSKAAPFPCLDEHVSEAEKYFPVALVVGVCEIAWGDLAPDADVITLGTQNFRA